MEVKRVWIVLAILLIVSSAGGCGDVCEAIPDPDIPLKTVTQNTEDDFINCEFDLPEDWICDAVSEFSICAIPREALASEQSGLSSQIPCIVDIRNVTVSTSEQMQTARKELLRGNPEPYRQTITQKPVENGQEENTGSLFDYFDLLLPATPSTEKTDNILHFEYHCYRGKQGKIAVVTYDCNLEGEQRKYMECFRENIPYVVSSTFDGTSEESFKNIALWAADSLQVTEHFSLENGTIQKLN